MTLIKKHNKVEYILYYIAKRTRCINDSHLYRKTPKHKKINNIRPPQPAEQNNTGQKKVNIMENIGHKFTKIQEMV